MNLHNIRDKQIERLERYEKFQMWLLTFAAYFLISTLGSLFLMYWEGLL